MSNVVRRGAVYYFRRRVPPQIQSVIGSTLIRESLDTREPKVARRLAADRNMHWERRFEEAEAKLAAEALAQTLRADLTDAEVQSIVDDYRRHLLWSDEQIRLHGLGGQQSGSAGPSIRSPDRGLSRHREVCGQRHSERAASFISQSGSGERAARQDGNFSPGKLRRLQAYRRRIFEYNVGMHPTLERSSRR